VVHKGLEGMEGLLREVFKTNKVVMNSKYQSRHKGRDKEVGSCGGGTTTRAFNRGFTDFQCLRLQSGDRGRGPNRCKVRDITTRILSEPVLERFM